MVGLHIPSMIKDDVSKNLKQKKAPVEQMETVHRDTTGKIVSLEEKLVTDKERLQKTNKEALATWVGGVKQKEEAAKYR